MSIPKFILTGCMAIGLTFGSTFASQTPEEAIRASLGEQTISKAQPSALLEAYKKAVTANPKQAHRIMALILSSSREDVLALVDDLVAIAIQALGDTMDTDMVANIVHTAVMYEPAAAARIVSSAVAASPDVYASTIVAAAVSALPRQMAGETNIKIIVKAATDAKPEKLDSTALLAVARQSLAGRSDGKEVLLAESKEALPPVGELDQSTLPIADAQPLEEFPRIPPTVLPPETPPPACP